MVEVEEDRRRNGGGVVVILSPNRWWLEGETRSGLDTCIILYREEANLGGRVAVLGKTHESPLMWVFENNIRYGSTQVHVLLMS